MSNDNKTKIALIFGGQSTEHDISCISAATVAAALSKDKYDITYIGITKEGHWLLVENPSDLSSEAWKDNTKRAIISPDSDHNLIIRDGDDLEVRKIDVAFPVLHGLYGEDGTIQGLFEMAHIPYVGCGHLASAVTMDKLFTKIIVDDIDIEQAKYVGVRAYELSDIEKVADKVEAERVYPMFIKPSCAGSSVGITKAKDRKELIEGLKKAADVDSKILVEETINGREIECAVYGYGDNAFATGVGEIKAAAEFYDFDAKYNNEDSLTIMDPELPEGKAEEIRNKALGIYRACDCFGMARVDFFLENGTNRVVFNEINAIPGHTSISMYPMLMDRAGHKLTDYLDGLIQMAYERHPQKQ